MSDPHIGAMCVQGALKTTYKGNMSVPEDTPDQCLKEPVYFVKTDKEGGNCI